MACKRKKRTKSLVGTIDTLVLEVDEKLSFYKVKFSGLTWREKVLLLVEVSNTIKTLGINSNPMAANVGARERIRLYLCQYVRTVVSASELEVVSGISEYARRIRELRVQDGYKILTGNSNDPEMGIELKPDEYYLVDIKPDRMAAYRWHVANRIRRGPEGGQVKILNYLMENVGQVVSSEELQYVSKASEFGRRVRELRTEQGYAISTKFTGRPDLKMGEYVLESKERIAEPHDRKIPFEVQTKVYERAKHSCQLCGWNHKKWSRTDPRILELHHITEHVKGGKNAPDNLMVLCNRCHDKVHAGKTHLPSKPTK